MPVTGNARSEAPVHPARTHWSRWQRVYRRGAERPGPFSQNLSASYDTAGAEQAARTRAARRG